MILFWLAVALVVGGVVGYLARQKGRSALWWGLYGAVFNVIALAHVIYLKPLDDRIWTPTRFGVPEAPQTCPNCGASVRGEAVICRHCRQPLYRGEHARFQPQHPEGSWDEPEQVQPEQSELPLGDAQARPQAPPQTQQKPRGKKPIDAEVPSWLDESFARIGQSPEPSASEPATSAPETSAPRPEVAPQPQRPDLKAEPAAVVTQELVATAPVPDLPMAPKPEPAAAVKPEPIVQPVIDEPRIDVAVPEPNREPEAKIEPKAEPKVEPALAARMPEAPKIVSPKVEAEKAETPKVETPTAEPLKAEQPKPAAPKHEPAKPVAAEKVGKVEKLSPTLNVFAAAKAAFDRPRPAPTVEPSERIRPNEEPKRRRPLLSGERDRTPLSSDPRSKPAREKRAVATTDQGATLKKVAALAAVAAVLGFLVPFAATFWPNGKDNSKIASSIGRTDSTTPDDPTPPAVTPPAPTDAAPGTDVAAPKLSTPQPPQDRMASLTPPAAGTPAQQSAAVAQEPPKAQGDGAPVDLTPPAKPAAEVKKAPTKPKVQKPLTQQEFAAMVDHALQSDAEGGASGDAVQAIQQKLRDNGYDPGSIDGRTGPKTVQAIRAYQRSVGMNPDGKIDMVLMERLGIVGPQINAFTENKR